MCKLINRQTGSNGPVGDQLILDKTVTLELVLMRHFVHTTHVNSAPSS